MQKTKKKINFCLFAEGNDLGPRQRRVLCRGPSHCPRQRFIGKILEHFFAEGHGWRPSAKTFFLKNKISLPRACVEALGKDFFQKKRIILCRGPSHCPRQRFFGKILQHFFAEGHGWRPSAKIFQKKRIILCRGPPETALGKDSVPGAGAVTAAFLCRVPLQPSAKALPSAR